MKYIKFAFSIAAAFCAVAAAPSKPAQNGGRSNPAASAKTAAKPIAKPAVKIPENLDGDPVWGQFPAVMAEYRGGKVTREEFVRYALAAQPNGKKWSRASAARTAPGLLKGMIDERLLAEAQKKAGYLPSAERTRTMLREKYAALPEETVKAIAVEVMRKEKLLQLQPLGIPFQRLVQSSAHHADHARCAHEAGEAGGPQRDDEICAGAEKESGPLQCAGRRLRIASGRAAFRPGCSV